MPSETCNYNEGGDGVGNNVNLTACNTPASLWKC